MVCELAESAAAALWPALLELRAFLGTAEALETERVGLRARGGTWSLLREPDELARAEREAGDGGLLLLVPLVPQGAERAEEAAPAPGVGLYSDERYRTGRRPFTGAPAGPELENFLRVYLPMLLGGLRARRQGGLFLTAHVAQSLDGRIACRNGHSQWISNQANLRHAHRIRALHDAVMVGRGTAEYDDPALTVRHVEGPDPVRVVLSAGGSLLDGEPERLRLFRDDGCLLVVSNAALEARGEARGRLPDRVRVVGLDAGPDGTIEPAELSRALASRGLHSVFLEGGSGTLSSYFASRAIDLLHVHLAPMILGSGIPGISLPEIDSLESARRLVTKHFLLDGELLVECREPGSATLSSLDAT